MSYERVIRRCWTMDGAYRVLRAYKARTGRTAWVFLRPVSGLRRWAVVEQLPVHLLYR